MQEVTQLPVKTKIALILSVSVTVLFTCIFVQQAFAYSNISTPLTPPVTPPNPTSTPQPTSTPTPTPNHPPVFKFPKGDSITVKRGERVSLLFRVKDADADTFTVDVTSKLPSGVYLHCAQNQDLTKPTVCTLTGTAEKAGTYNIKLKATDVHNASTKETVKLTVTKK